MGKQAGIDDSGDSLWASLIQNRVRDYSSHTAGAAGIMPSWWDVWRKNVIPALWMMWWRPAR